MITTIAHTTLLVHDYDEARAFYCDKLGFFLIEDKELGAGKRWVRIKPSHESLTEILLVKALSEAEKAAVGQQTAGRVLYFFYTNDFDHDYEQMKAWGIEFTEGPLQKAHGKVAVFKDLYGNRMDLIEPV